MSFFVTASHENSCKQGENRKQKGSVRRCCGYIRGIRRARLEHDEYRTSKQRTNSAHASRETLDSISFTVSKNLRSLFWLMWP